MSAIAQPTPSSPARQGLAALTLGAIGVVYGDIGTSPLYTLAEVFGPATGLRPDAASIVGAVSALFWALMLVVTLKYVLLILRADNRGEGGGLALTALAAQALGPVSRRRGALLLFGVFGATLFYGDSVITQVKILCDEQERLRDDMDELNKTVELSAKRLDAFDQQNAGAAGNSKVLWYVVGGIAWLVTTAIALYGALHGK